MNLLIDILMFVFVHRNRHAIAESVRYYYNTCPYINDNVDFAKASGRPFPPYIIAAIYMTFVRIGWQFDKIKRLLKRNNDD